MKVQDIGIKNSKECSIIVDEKGRVFINHFSNHKNYLYLVTIVRPFHFTKKKKGGRR